jgi:hypothetical protein
MDDLVWILGGALSAACIHAARRIYLLARKRDHGY